jgi:hypothetical protein
MDPVVIVFVVSVPAAFAAGVITHKYVISEAASIKQHVTEEIAEVRARCGGSTEESRWKSLARFFQPSRWRQDFGGRKHGVEFGVGESALAFDD